MINIGGYEKNGYNASLGASRKERPGNHGSLKRRAKSRRRIPTEPSFHRIWLMRQKPLHPKRRCR